MKPWIKKSLFASLICFIAGISICISVLAFGNVPDDIRNHFAISNDDIHDVEDETHFEKYAEEDNDISVQTFNDIERINLELDIGTFRIINGESFSVSADKKMSKFIDVSKDGESLSVKSKDNNQSFNFLEGKNSPVIITVPYDEDFDSLSVSSLTASVTIEDISTEELNIDLRAGTLDMRAVSAEDIDMKVLAGSVTIDGADTDHFYCDCDAGTVDFSGYIAYDSRVVCNVGRVNLSLEDPYIFKFKAKPITGEISILDRTIVHSDDDKGNITFSKDADTPFYLESKAGTIVVKKLPH